MRRILSIICILSIAFTTILPMHFASAESEYVTIGDDTYVLDGVTFEMGSQLFNTVDFEDSDFAHLNDGYNANNKSIDDFTTLTGAESDDEGHGKVMQIRGNAENSGQNTRLLSNKQVSGGVFVLEYDMYVSGEFFSSTTQAFSIATRDAAGNRTWNSAIAGQINYIKSNGAWYIAFTHPDGTKENFYEINFGEWFRFTLIMDLRKHTFSFLINNVPALVNGGMKDTTFVTQDSFDTTSRMAKNGEYVLIDNLTSYQYFPRYNADVKGVDTDGEFIENVSYETGSKIAVNFSTPMKVSEFAGDVAVMSSREIPVKTVEFSESDYDVTTDTLYITTSEALEPSSNYKVILNASSLNANNEVVLGVVTADNISYNEDVVCEFVTADTPYGISDITHEALSAGSTINATISLRIDEVVDSNLVLVLYVDGKMRSISSEPIVATEICDEYTLPVNVPEDGSEFELCAMLLGTDYKLIDTYTVE